MTNRVLRDREWTPFARLAGFYAGFTLHDGRYSAESNLVAGDSKVPRGHTPDPPAPHSNHTLIAMSDIAMMLQFGGGAAALVGGILQVVDAALAERDAAKVGDVAGYIDELEASMIEYAEQSRAVKLPDDAMIGGMSINAIDEIITGAAAPARAANLRVKLKLLKEQEENAKRRKPMARAALVLVIAGSIVALVGTGIPNDSDDKPENTPTTQPKPATTPSP